MTERFEGRRAVITGASRGIGAGIAQRLAAHGADVALVARTLDQQDQLPGSLRATQAACRTYGTRVGTIAADLTDPNARARVIPEAVEILGGPIDILVNNAVAAVAVPITEVSAEQQRIAFECNVIAPLELAQAVIPRHARGSCGLDREPHQRGRAATPGAALLPRTAGFDDGAIRHHQSGA